MDSADTHARATQASRLRIAIARKAFPHPPTLVLEDLEFSVEPGEFVSIVGPSGAGKSTLLNIVAGLDRHYEGEVSSAAGAEDERKDSKIGYVFQSPRLMPWLSALDNVRLVLPPDSTSAETAREVLREVGLGDFEDAYPGQLSGGMQRRVALARAFGVNPALLLMDEPFGSLDEPLAWRLRESLQALWRRRGSMVLFVTHHLEEALSLSDRVLFLSSRPARVVLEQAVDRPRPRGRDHPGVERLRSDLLARHPELLAGRVGDEASAGEVVEEGTANA